MKITVPRILTPPFFTANNGPARRRSSLLSTFHLVALCVALGVITLLIADGGGFIFLTGAVATIIAAGLLAKRVLRLSTQFVKTASTIVK